MTGLWPPGTATGTGSLPGTDILAAARLAFDTLPMPFLPELPDRGVGGDLVARGTAFLAGLHVDLQPSGWRLVARPGMDARRTSDMLARDLDALEEVGSTWAGPFKLQVCGPWTLAAALETSRGGQALADPGASRDLAESLAEGLADHLNDVRRRLPHVTALYVQLDEPSLAAVAAGHIRTASGFGTVRTPEPRELAGSLTTVFEKAEKLGDVIAGTHCCAGDPPVALLAKAGARWVSIDLVGMREGPLDEQLGEAMEAGLGLIAGVIDPRRPLPGVGPAVAPVKSLASRLGMTDEARALIAVSPACGLPGRPLAEAEEILKRTVEIAQELSRG